MMNGDLYQSPEVLEQVWVAADADGIARTTPAERAPALVRSCHCALIRSSLISRASPFSMALLDWLIQEEVWSLLEALAAAQGTLTTEQRDVMTQYLDRETPRLDADELAMLSNPSRTLDDVYLQLNLLISLAARMSASDQSHWLQTILDRAYADPRPWYYTQVIELFIYHQLDVSPPVVQHVLDRISALEPTVYLTGTLGRMAQNLAPDKRSHMIDRIVALTRTVADPVERIRTLHYSLYWNLGDLRDVIYREALAHIHALPTSTDRLIAWILLANNLAEPDLRSALRDAQESENPANLPPLLNRLAELGYSTETMTLVQTRIPPADQLNTLMLLADKLAAAELSELLRMINALDSAEARSSSLRRVIRYLPEPLLRDLLYQMRMQGDTYARFDILVGLREDPLSESIGEELLALLQARSDEQMAPYILHRAAKYLPDRFLGQMLVMAQQVQEPRPRLQILLTLASRLDPHELPDILSEVLKLVPRIQRDHTTPEPIGQVVQLLPTLAPSRQHSLLAQAQEAAQAIPDAYWRVLALATLLPHLAPTEKQAVQAEALTLAQNFPGAYQRANALMALAPTLTEQERISILEQAFAAAIFVGDQYQMGYDEWAMREWVAKANSLSDEELYGLWSTVLHNLGEGLRTNLLTKLKYCLPLIDRLGGSAALTGIAEAILSVGAAVP